MQKLHLKILGLFVALTILMRALSFFISVLDHDESTYIVISDYLLRGKTYFVDVIDTKPIGVFLIYAAMQKALGASIFMLRLGSALWIAMTAFLIFLTHRSFMKGKYGGIAAGVIYILMNSFFTYFGLSPNSETYFNLFTILGLLIMIRSQKLWHFLPAGLSLGIGMMVKHVVMFDALAFGLFLLWSHLGDKKRFIWALKGGILMAFASTLPLCALIYYYSSIGHLEVFWFYTFEAASRYPVSLPISKYFEFLVDFLLRFAPITYCFFYVILNSDTLLKLRRLGALWTILVFIVVLIPGNLYGHYFIHLMLPFSFVAGQFFDLPRHKMPVFIQRLMTPKVSYPLLGVLFVLNLFFQKIDCIDKTDYPKQIFQFLKDRIREEDKIYTSVSHQILYHFLRKESPILHLHPSLFWEPKHIQALEIDVKKELERITSDPPRFIIWRADRKDDRLDDFLQKNYSLIQTFGRELIFERGTVNGKR